MNNKVTICTTATFRKDIVERTFHSFFEKMFFMNPPEVILNIDKIGIENETHEDIIYAVAKYFKISKCFIPKNPSFPRAFIQILSESETKYTFFLEDDWELIRNVDLAEMINIMDENPDLAVLRLPRWESSTFCRQWNKREIPWNGSFFEIPDDLKGLLGFSGNPSLIRTSWLHNVLSFISPDRDPEKQIKGRNVPCFDGYRFGIFQKQNEGVAIVDIGSQWRILNKLKKDSKSRFVTWEIYN